MFHIPHEWLIALIPAFVLPAWELLKRFVFHRVTKQKEYAAVLDNTKSALELLQQDIKVITDSRDRALEEVRTLKAEYQKKVQQLNLEIEALRKEVTALKLGN